MNPTGENWLRKNGTRISPAFGSAAIAATTNLGATDPELVGPGKACIDDTNQRGLQRIADPQCCLPAALTKVAV